MPVRKADRVIAAQFHGDLFVFRIGNQPGWFAIPVPALNGGRLWLYDATSTPIEDPRVIAALERAVRANH